MLNVNEPSKKEDTVPQIKKTIGITCKSIVIPPEFNNFDYKTATAKSFEPIIDLLYYPIDEVNKNGLAKVQTIIFDYYMNYRMYVDCILSEIKLPTYENQT